MKPNILVFVTDQQRYDWLSCMGNKILETPNIDSIAQRGVLFERAYCSTPLCMPSRATMWTGLPASVHGARTNGVDTDDYYPTLPGILHDNGYKSISVGKIHLKSWHLTPENNPNVDQFSQELLPECETLWHNRIVTELPKGYFGLDVAHFLGGHGSYCFGEYVQWLQKEHPDVYKSLHDKESSKPTTGKPDNYYSTVPNELYYNEWITKLTIEEMDKCQDQPFFMWCSFPDPHFPFGPPAPYNEMYSKEQMPDPIAWEDDRSKMNELYHQEYYEKKGIFSLDGGPSEWSLEQIKETKALAWGLVKSVDDCIGKVMNHLKEIGKEEDTIIVFLSDHGELMGDHGMYCKGPFHYDGLLHVPMMMSYPKKIQSGMKTKALACILDFMPTILDLADIKYPEPEIRHWNGPFENKDIYEGVSRLPGKSLVPIMTGEKDKVQDSVLVEDDDDVRSVNLRTIITEQYKLTVYAGRDYGELFDLIHDPEERNNLWEEQEYQTIKADLMAKLLNDVIETQNRVKQRIGVA